MRKSFHALFDGFCKGGRQRKGDAVGLQNRQVPTHFQRKITVRMENRQYRQAVAQIENGIHEVGGSSSRPGWSGSYPSNHAMCIGTYAGKGSKIVHGGL